MRPKRPKKSAPARDQDGPAVQPIVPARTVWRVTTEYEDIKRSKAFPGQRLRHMAYDVLANSMGEAAAIVLASNEYVTRKETVISVERLLVITQLPTDRHTTVVVERSVIGA